MRWPQNKESMGLHGVGYVCLVSLLCNFLGNSNQEIRHIFSVCLS